MFKDDKGVENVKRTLPTWCKEVKKSMIDDDINMTELAERVGMCRNYVSGVVNGRVLSLIHI